MPVAHRPGPGHGITSVRSAILLSLALTVASCAIRGEVTEGGEPSLGIMAIIANRSASDLEMTFSSEGVDHASEGGGGVPGCTLSTMAVAVLPGDSWELVITKSGAAAGQELIRLSTENRPDLVVPPGRARRLDIAVDDLQATLAGNIVISPEMADDDQGVVAIPDCG